MALHGGRVDTAVESAEYERERAGAPMALGSDELERLVARARKHVLRGELTVGDALLAIKATLRVVDARGTLAAMLRKRLVA